MKIVKLSEVGYFTENVVSSYIKGINEANTLEKLILFLEKWEGLADDAISWIEIWRRTCGK